MQGLKISYSENIILQLFFAVIVTEHHSVAESASTSGQLARLTEEVDFLRGKARQLQQELDEVCLSLVVALAILVSTSSKVLQD